MPIGPIKIKALHREAVHAQFHLGIVERRLSEARHDLYARQALDLTDLEARLNSIVATAERLRAEIAKVNR